MKDFWFRFLASVNRLSVIDARRCLRSIKFKGVSSDLMQRGQNKSNNFLIEHNYEIEITKFSNTLTKSLEDNIRNILAPRRSHISA